VCVCGGVAGNITFIFVVSDYLTRVCIVAVQECKHCTYTDISGPCFVVAVREKYSYDFQRFSRVGSSLLLRIANVPGLFGPQTKYTEFLHINAVSSSD
jgi:hypothetical protein